MSCKKVYLYVTDTLADWEIAFLLPELRTARYFKDKTMRLPIVTVGKTLAPVRTMGGFSIRPDITVADFAGTAAVTVGAGTDAHAAAGSTESAACQNDSESLLILPGAETWLHPAQSDILLVAKRRIETGLPVAAICGAVTGLASVGALNRMAHTGNDKTYLKTTCPAYTGEDRYRQTVACADRHLITASSIAPVEFAYEILKLLDVFTERTLEAWRALYVDKDPRFYYELICSLAEAGGNVAP